MLKKLKRFFSGKDSSNVRDESQKSTQVSTTSTNSAPAVKEQSPNHDSAPVVMEVPTEVMESRLDSVELEESTDEVDDFLQSILDGNAAALRKQLAEHRILNAAGGSAASPPTTQTAISEPPNSAATAASAAVAMSSPSETATNAAAVTDGAAQAPTVREDSSSPDRRRHPASRPAYRSSAARSLADYELVAYLGKGTFAEVTLARHKRTLDLFAIKKIEKLKVKQEGCVERTFTERQVLSSLRHPFLVTLQQAFQSGKCLYFVLEFAQGGDLYNFSTEKLWSREMRRTLRKLRYPYYGDGSTVGQNAGEVAGVTGGDGRDVEISTGRSRYYLQLQPSGTSGTTNASFASVDGRGGDGMGGGEVDGAHPPSFVLSFHKDDRRLRHARRSMRHLHTRGASNISSTAPLLHYSSSAVLPTESPQSTMMGEEDQSTGRQDRASTTDDGGESQLLTHRTIEEAFHHSPRSHAELILRGYSLDTLFGPNSGYSPALEERGEENASPLTVVALSQLQQRQQEADTHSATAETASTLPQASTSGVPPTAPSRDPSEEGCPGLQTVLRVPADAEQASPQVRVPQGLSSNPTSRRGGEEGPANINNTNNKNNNTRPTMARQALRLNSPIDRPAPTSSMIEGGETASQPLTTSRSTDSKRPPALFTQSTQSLGLSTSRVESASVHIPDAAPDDARLPIRLVAFYAVEIALVLEYIHQSGFIYRDLKPENILMKRDGHVMLTDFGVAKSRKGAAIAASSGGGDTTEEKVPSPTVERAASFTGTAQYMSPEMLLGTSHDCATDWWSFGCLLFEWANGRKPFDDPNQLKLFRSIVEEDVVVSPHDFKLVALEVHLRITQLYLRYQELFTPLLSPLDVNAAASPGGAGNPSFSHPSDSLLPSMRNALSTSGFHERADLSMPGQTPRNVSFRLNVGADGGMMMFPQHQWHSTENLPVAERDVFLHHAMSELEEARDLLRDLILQLLQRQPQKRLCGADVLEHPFFSCRYVAAELYDQMVLFNPPRQWASAASSPSVSYQRISTEATADFDSITNLGLSHSARRCSARRPFQGDDVREESSMPVADVVGADASNFPMGHFTAEDFLELSPTPRPPDWRERFTQLKINPLYVPRLRAPDDLRFFPDAVTATGVNAALEQHRKLRAAKEEQFERLQSILTAGTCGSARTPLQSRSVVLLSTDEGDVASTSTPLPSARPHRSRRRGDEGTSSTSGNLSSPEKGSSNRRRGGRRGSSAALSCVQSTTAAGGGPSSACMSAAISTAKEDELLSSPIMLPARVPQPSKYKSSSRASSLLSSDFGVEERVTDEARNTQAEKLVPHLPIPQLPSILRNAAAPTTSGGGRDGEEDDDLLAKTAVLPAEFLTAALATIAAQRQKEELNAASAPAKLTDPTTDLRNTAESARSAMDDTRSTPSTELDGLSATRAPMHDGQASEALAKASHRPNTYYEDDALEEGVSLFASMPATARRPNQPVDTSMELSLSATGHSVTTEHLTSPCAAEAAHVDPTRLPSSAQVLSSPMEGSTPTGSMVEFMSGTTPQSPQPITSSESNRMLSPSTSEGAESGESGAMQRYRSPSPAAGLYDERHPLCGSLLSEPNPITRENTIIQDELMSNDSLHFRSRSSLSSLRHSHAGAEALPLFFRAQADAVDDLSPALATDERSTTNCFVREEGCPSSGRGSTRSGDGRAHSPTIRVLSMATAEEDGRQTGDEYQRQAASESSTTDDGSTTSTTSDSAMILVTNGSMISSNGSFALGTPMMMEHPMMAFAERHLPDAAVASHMGRSLSEPGTGASPRYRNRSFHHHSVVAITDSGPMELSATNVIPSMTLHGVAYDVDDGPTYAQGNRSRRCFSESSISHTPADRSRGVERARPGAHFPSTTQSPLQQPPPGVGTAEARAMEASPLEVKSMRSAVHQRLMASRTGARVTSLLGSGHGGPTREGANVHVPVLHSTSPAGRRPTSPQSATSFGSPREANHSAFSCVDTRQPPSAIRTSGGDPLDVTSPTTDRPSSSRVGMSNDFYNFSYRTGSPADGDSTDHVLGEERYPLPLSTNAAQGRHSNDGSPTSRPSAGGPSLYNEMSLSNFEHFSNFSFAVQPQGSMCFDVGSPPT